MFRDFHVASLMPGAGGMLRQKADAAPAPVEMEMTRASKQIYIRSQIRWEPGGWLGGPQGGDRQGHPVAGLLEEREGKQVLEDEVLGAEGPLSGRGRFHGASEALCKEPDVYSTAREATGGL